MDDESQRVDAVNELGSKIWLTECGHSYYTMWNAVNRFNIKADFEIGSLITYYAQWIREGNCSLFRLDTENIKFTVQDPCQIVRKAYGESIAEDLRFVAKRLVGG